MTLIASIDGANRRIYLHADTVGATVNPIDIYKEMRTLRRTDEGLRIYDVFMNAEGNVSKGGGKFTERYAVLLSGTRIVPFDTSHVLTINGTIITDDGQEGIAVFDKASLALATSVDIAYIPPQVEVIVVSTGSGLSEAENAKLLSIPTEAENATAVWGEVSRTLTESAGLSTEENAKLMAIPTTPLLDNDARLDNLDAPISTSGTSPTEIWSHATALSLVSNVTHIRDMTGGRWKVQGTQMIFYKEDNTTEVARFNLTDSSGTPSAENPLQRIKV